jgi:formate hydrogenlyase subunit 3/multisubunit Na+/H+ antiporter MnhD subunit
MPAPILFILIPLVVAPLVYLAQAVRGLAIALAVLAAAALAWLAVALPFGRPVELLGGMFSDDSAAILGRAFLMEPADRLALAFLFGQAAFIYLVSAIAFPGRTFLPASLGCLALLSAALLVRPFLFAAIFLELAAALAVLMLAAETPGVRLSPKGTRGALRYLVYTTLALPFILFTGWLLEASAASPADPTFTRQATLALMFGFAVLLAVVPFHSWVPALAEHAPPLAAVFVYTVIRQAVLFLLLAFLSNFDWLNQNPVVYRALTLAGGGMVLFGAIFVFGQRNFGRMLGYVVLIDFGAVMLGLGLGTQAGVESALITSVLRGVALPFWAAGVVRLRVAAGSDQFDDLRGVGRREPVAAAAVILSLLSLVGFPLTAGFTGRWTLLSLLAQIHPTGAILLLIGMVSVAYVCARGLAYLLSRQAPAIERAALPSDRFDAALFTLGFTLILALGLFPQWLLPAVSETAAAFSPLRR